MQFDAWPPALLGSWDEARDEGDLVRQGVTVGAPALERAVLVPLSLLCMSLFSASREQPLATGLPRASSRCLPDGSSSFSCSPPPSARPLSGWRRANDALAKPAHRIAGLGGLLALAAAGTVASFLFLKLL